MTSRWHGVRHRLMRPLAGVAIGVLAACTTPDTPRTSESAGASPAGAPAAAARDTGATLGLDGEGVRVVLLPSGASRALAFGSPMDETMRSVTALFDSGAPGDTAVVVVNGECNLTLAGWPGRGVMLSFSGGSAGERRFVGWTVAAPRDSGVSAPRLTTASGIGLGSTRAGLERAHPVTVTRSTLGVEFTAGGVSGILSSTAPDARVEHLWAGQVCLAR